MKKIAIFDKYLALSVSEMVQDIATAQLLWHVNRKPYPSFRMVPIFSMTFVTFMSEVKSEYRNL